MCSIKATESSLQHICSTRRGGRLTFLLILFASNVIPALSSSSFPSPSSLSLSRLKSKNLTPTNVIESNCNGLNDLWGLRDNNNIFAKNTVGNINIVRRPSPLPFLSLRNKRRLGNRSSLSNSVIESLRGGGGDGSLVDDDEEEYDSDDDDESEDDGDDESCEDSEGESDNADTDDDLDETDDTDETEEESSEGEDESEYGGYEIEYDEEGEYNEDEGKLASSISSRSNSGTEQDYDEPLVLSSMQDMAVTLGVLVSCNKLDLTNTRLIRVFRFAYIAYVICAQLFLVYVRHQAHKINDRTKLTLNNPLSNILKNQIGSAGEGGIVKDMANSFLSSESTIMEYDLSQAKNMNNALLLPMLMLYFLHFKMGQVQPLFYQTVMGIKTVMTSPLFQIYVLGRNLERPFRNAQEDKLGENQDESGQVPGLGGDMETNLDEDGEEVEQDAEESDSSDSDSSDSDDDSDYSDSDGDTEYDDDSDEEE